MDPSKDTKSKANREIAHVVAFAIANVAVMITNMTGNPDEEYQVNRVRKPGVIDTTTVPPSTTEAEATVEASN